MVIIRHNPDGDTRTASADVTYGRFQAANDMHINDVKNVIREIVVKLMDIKAKHDHTKKDFEELFYKNFIETIRDGKPFETNDWFQKHIKEERHHLDYNCPDDVNLLDVLEMVVDSVCAGMARTGSPREIKLDPVILEKALNNTVTMIAEMITLKPALNEDMISFEDYCRNYTSIPMTDENIDLMKQFQHSHEEGYQCCVLGGRRQIGAKLTKAYHKWVDYIETGVIEE